MPSEAAAVASGSCDLGLPQFQRGGKPAHEFLPVRFLGEKGILATTIVTHAFCFQRQPRKFPSLVLRW